MKTGVLILNMGSPTTAENAHSFLKNLLSDPAIINFPFSSFFRPIIARVASKRRAPILKKRLEEIGGKSPLLDITEQQAKSLSTILEQIGDDWRVAVGMRYSEPYIKDSFGALVEAGCKKIIACPLYPQYCQATTGSSFAEVKRINRANPNIETFFIDSYHDHPGYIEALASTVRDSLDDFPVDIHPYIVTIFSAHGIPDKIARNDVYVDQIRKTAENVANLLELRHWRLSFQSRFGAGKWTTPSTSETIEMVAAFKGKFVVLVPISFVSDNLETLYDMDIILKKEASEIGIEISRAPAINARPVFINALADIIKSKTNTPNY